MGRAEASLAHWLQYVGVRSADALLVRLPWGPGRWLGRRMGDLGRLLDGRKRKGEMLRNIRAAFPEMSEPQASAVARECYRWLAASIVDVRNFMRLGPEAWTDGMLTTSGAELLERRPRGTGIIFVSGHLGAWEMVGIASKALGYPALSFARPRSNPLIENYVRGLRESTGQRILNHRGEARRALEALRSGRNIAMLIDQDARHRGLFVEFFGRPASTVTSAARLAIFTGAPVAVVCGRRIPGRNGFHVSVLEVMHPDRTAPLRQEVTRITRRCTEIIEDLIRQRPAEWLWFHRRWNTFPGKYADPGVKGPVAGSDGEVKRRQRWGNVPAPASGAPALKAPQD